MTEQDRPAEESGQPDQAAEKWFTGRIKLTKSIADENDEERQIGVIEADDGQIYTFNKKSLKTELEEDGSIYFSVSERKSSADDDPKEAMLEDQVDKIVPISNKKRS